MGYDFNYYPRPYLPNKGFIVQDKCIPDCVTKVETFQQPETKCAAPCSDPIICYRELWIADFLAKLEFGEIITLTLRGSIIPLTGSYAGQSYGSTRITTNSIPGCAPVTLAIDTCQIETVSRGCCPEDGFICSAVEG